jgi:LPXTG-site transpeptidase (sortase) family protein
MRNPLSGKAVRMFIGIFCALLFSTILFFSFGAVPVSAATITVCPAGPPTCDHATIQAAITAAAVGDTITVAAGTYTENINITKRLKIIGAGSTTIITQTAAGAGDSRVGVIQLSASGASAADPILLQNLRVQPVSLAGISVGRFTEATGTSVSYVKLDHVEVIGTNTSPSTEQERGLYVDLTSSLQYLEVVDSAFNNLTYGWYLHKQVSADTSTVRYVQVTDTTFNHNNHKGIYAEKLSDATFKTCTVDQNGYDSSILPSWFRPWSAGVDLNLKAGAYQNITFDNCTVTNNAHDEAKEGVGLTAKARDDGGYAAFPATLNTVTIVNGTYTGNERGIRIGEPGKNNATPTNVTIHNASIHSNTKNYSGVDGSVYGDVSNQLGGGVLVDATNNWWGDARGPSDGTGASEVPPCTAAPTNELNADGVGAGVTDNIDYCPWLGIMPTPPGVALTTPPDGAVLAVGPTQIIIQFDKDVKNDGSAGAANNIINYLLVEANGNGFQTADCATGVKPNDLPVAITSATYTNNGGAGPFTATLDINGGAALNAGSYRLFVCGTTSIEDLFNVELNNGAFDSVASFTVSAAGGGAAGGAATAAEAAGDPESLPATGFPVGQVSQLPPQPKDQAYQATEMRLIIPTLDVELPITGIPPHGDAWDVTWLGNRAGYLEGTAFPTWAGNTAITAHVWTAYNTPGPFAGLKTLAYGDQVRIEAFGQTYIYEVRENRLARANRADAVLKHEELDWVTLLTCEFYNPINGKYLFRRVVRAVLVEVETR